ncbi:hypothetical protein PTKIN_Ptkin14bG0228300 [Pterospermum kingtungense]
MASIPQFYSNYSCPNDFSQFPNPLLIPQENCNIAGVVGTGAGAIPGAATWGGEDEVSFPMFLDNVGGLDVFQQESDLTSSVPAALFPELIGISSELSVPTALPDNNVGGFCGIGTIQNFGSRYQFQDVCDFGEECSGFVHQDFKPIDSTHVRENWQIQGNRMVPAMEDNNLKVGRYSVEERKDRILRYLKKRNQRNFNKTIKVSSLIFSLSEDVYYIYIYTHTQKECALTLYSCLRINSTLAGKP